MDENFYSDPIFQQDKNHEKHHIEKLKKNTMPKPKIVKKQKNKPFHAHKLRELF